ncbi:hypothetical protein Tsubulata_008000 [Turnera subulata]|uniref:Histone-lysine N-methyltransferase n=1 Tax=Turnera subulata TaxID=218843 RepID=A0A9Q0J9L8_9ROSI|nr:hypothetical protein Tsubulata_008000 [Turnera subulata]
MVVRGGSKRKKMDVEEEKPRRVSARIKTKTREEKERLVKRRMEILDRQEKEAGGENKKKNVTPEEEGAVEGNGAGKASPLAGKRDQKGGSPKREASAGRKSYKAEEKKVLVKRRMEILDDLEEGTRSRSRRRVSVRDDEAEKAAALAENGGNTQLVAGDSDKSASLRVKETLRLFNRHYLHFVQEEELRCSKEDVDRKASDSKNKKTSKNAKSKSKNAPAPEAKHKAKRPDLKAISKASLCIKVQTFGNTMIQSSSVLYPEKRIGDLPGINVGHQFYSRAEMCAVGMHGHWLNGIDYMGAAYKKGEYSHFNFPLAVVIVLSGMYEDDEDDSEDVIYTGQGGHNLTGDKRQIRDQVLKRGNLALKNCVEQSVPVRVIRGLASNNSYSGKVYTYDGLYKVVQYWAEEGKSGFSVFKFRLRRLEGQPILTTEQVRFIYERAPRSISEIEGLACEDISGGQEDAPIPATNLIDKPPTAPAGFTYCKSMQIDGNVKLPANVKGCNCKGGCVDPKTCSCAKLNGCEFPYVNLHGGRLIQARDVVFECGPLCGCGPSCVNRTSQRGLKHRLEVFRTVSKGWAVRSWDFIPSGAPVCEYIGVLRRTEDMDHDHVPDNNYIFEIDCLQTMRGLDGRERRLKDVSIPDANNSDRHDDQKSEPEFCIDAGSSGNIARFINHSCEPNLFVQCVLSSHHDIKQARIMLFAADNIPPLQELTYDYGYVLDSVHGPDGKIKQMPCYCGAAGCRKRLF